MMPLPVMVIVAPLSMLRLALPRMVRKFVASAS
jgi:hypothetical protein